MYSRSWMLALSNHRNTGFITIQMIYNFKVRLEAFETIDHVAAQMRYIHLDFNSGVTFSKSYNWWSISSVKSRFNALERRKYKSSIYTFKSHTSLWSDWKHLLESCGYLPSSHKIIRQAHLHNSAWVLLVQAWTSMHLTHEPFSHIQFYNMIGELLDEACA